MNQEPPQPTIPESEEVHAQPVLEQSRALQASRQEAQTPQRSAGDIAKDIVLGTGAVAGIATLSVLGVNAAESQAEYQHDQNQKWAAEANQNQQQKEFQEGLDKGTVTIKTPAPQDSTLIPSPEQVQPGSTVYIPSPEQIQPSTQQIPSPIEPNQQLETK